MNNDFVKLDMADEWVNGAYDENGDDVQCGNCGANLYYDGGDYICRRCGTKVARKDFFRQIDACLPSGKCIGCWENYPMCKEGCYE